MRKVFGFGLLLSFVFSTFYLFSDQVVVAQTPTRAQQIEALSKTLTIIGEAIRTSPQLTDTERLVLYTQLVTISDTVVKLQKNENVPNTKILEDENKIDFTNAILSYDVAKPADVKAETFFASTSPQTRVFNYPQLLDYNSFGQKMSAVRQFGTYDLAQDLGLSQVDVRRATHITGRNPARDKVLELNSNEAYQLAEEFGKYSIVTNVDVFPGNKIGTFEFKSDQAEILKIEIKKNPTQIDPKDPKSDDTKYSYYQTFEIADTRNVIRTNPKDQDKNIIVETLIEDVERGELLELLKNLFGSHPLASEIKDYDDKILEFMFENESYLSAGENANYKIEDRKCYDEADALIMSQWAMSFLSTMNVQHYPVSDIFTLQAPVRSTDGGAGFSCKNIKKIF